jgi:RimJ/RimL family protein N-acetyltransferase
MIQQPLAIRTATVEDVPFIKAMMWEAILSSPVLIRDSGLKELRLSQDHQWEEWVKKPRPVFIAEDATGQKLGALSLRSYPGYSWDFTRSWEIGIGVAPEARRQGVGQLLIERALDYCRETDVPYLVLTVDPTNRVAQALYRKTGFLIKSKRHGVIEMRFYFKTLSEDDPQVVAQRRYFIQYWTNAAYSSGRHRLFHCAPYHVEHRQFKKAGVKPDDFVYGIAVIKGQLHLIVKYEVTKLMSYTEAKAEFKQSDDLDPEADHLITERATSYSFEPPIDTNITQALRLLENGIAQPLPYLENGDLNRHRLRGVKEITRESAYLLDGFVEDFRIRWRQD